jgi:hypothetical protein
VPPLCYVAGLDEHQQISGSAIMADRAGNVGATIDGTAAAAAAIDVVTVEGLKRRVATSGAIARAGGWLRIRICCHDLSRNEIVR